MSNIAKTTKAHQEILHAYTVEYLTVKKIALRRGTTPRAVRMVIRKLRAKGLISDTLRHDFPPSPPYSPKGGGREYPKREVINLTTPKIRLHGEQFKVYILKILNKSKYEQLIGHSLDMWGATVKFWDKVIEIYSPKETEGWQANTEEEAQDKCHTHYLELLKFIEKELELSLLNGKYTQVYRVKAHYATLHGGLATHYKTMGINQLVLYEGEGRAWFIIDFSQNKYLEHETVHPETALDDSKAINHILQDIRQHPGSLTLHQLTEQNKITAGQISNVASSLNVVVGLLKTTIEVLAPKNYAEQYNNIKEDKNRKLPDYIG